MTTPPAEPPVTDPPPPADPSDEEGYAKFSSWMKRFAEENKPAPEKTVKPKGFLDSFLGFGG